MASLEEDLEKVRNLYREAFVVLGDVNKLEKTLSRIKNEATELTEKMLKLSNKHHGNEA